MYRTGSRALSVVVIAAVALFSTGAGEAAAQQGGIDNPISAFFGAIFGGNQRQQQQQASPPPQRQVRPSQPVPNRQSRPARRSSREAAPRRERRTRPAQQAPAKPAKVAKNPEAMKVVVFGGGFAAGLAEGLDEAFVDNPDVEVVSAAAEGAGLVAEAENALQQTVRAHIADPEKEVDVAVVMIGENDRKPVPGSGEDVSFGTERWRDLYAQRVENMMQIFLAKGVPLYWVGLPPVADGETSADFGFFNEIFRARGYRTGADFVDIWNGFVDESNAYAQSGPDLKGEIRELRRADGTGFTAAGNRKLAHFVARELRRDFVRDGEVIAASPSAAEGPRPYRPSEEALATGRGPIVTLSSAPRPGELLAGGLDSEPAPPEDSAYHRIIVQGNPPEPQPGRSDDFSWPRERAGS